MGIYDLYIVLKGYPFLHEELDITFTERCCDVMETGLTKLDIGLSPRIADLRVMLRAFGFRGFPLVDGERFIGYLRRENLEDLLNKLETERGEDDVLTMQDLMAITDSTVMRMVPDTPLSQAHQVFLQLGCQHIFVVDSDGFGSPDSLLGIISKKNFLKFLKQGKVGHMPDQSCDDAALPGSTIHSTPSTTPTHGRLSVVDVALA